MQDILKSFFGWFHTGRGSILQELAGKDSSRLQEKIDKNLMWWL